MSKARNRTRSRSPHPGEHPDERSRKRAKSTPVVKEEGIDMDVDQETTRQISRTPLKDDAPTERAKSAGSTPSVKDADDDLDVKARKTRNANVGSHPEENAPLESERAQELMRKAKTYDQNQRVSKRDVEKAIRRYGENTMSQNGRVNVAGDGFAYYSGRRYEADERVCAKCRSHAACLWPIAGRLKKNSKACVRCATTGKSCKPGVRYTKEGWKELDADEEEATVVSSGKSSKTKKQKKPGVLAVDGLGQDDIAKILQVVDGLQNQLTAQTVAAETVANQAVAINDTLGRIEASLDSLNHNIQVLVDCIKSDRTDPKNPKTHTSASTPNLAEENDRSNVQSVVKMRQADDTDEDDSDYNEGDGDNDDNEDKDKDGDGDGPEEKYGDEDDSEVDELMSEE